MRARGHRARLAVSAAVALAALALSAGCASAGSGGASAASSTVADTNLAPHTGSAHDADATAAVSSATVARLTRLAEQAAAERGGEARSAEAVYSSRRAANLALSGDIVNTDPNEAVWAIAVVTKAPVVCGSCRYPAGAKPPQGTVITLVVDASSFDTVDSGLGDRQPNLATLGTPVPLQHV